MVALLPEIAAVEPPAVQRRARSVGHLLREAVMILMAVREEDALHVGDLEAEPLRPAPSASQASSVSGPVSMSVMGSRRITWTLTGPTGKGVGRERVSMNGEEEAGAPRRA